VRASDEEQMDLEIFDHQDTDCVLMSNGLSFIKGTQEVDKSQTMDSKPSTPPKEGPSLTESLVTTQSV
jgi:hypothetical protein